MRMKSPRDPLDAPPSRTGVDMLSLISSGLCVNPPVAKRTPRFALTVNDLPLKLPTTPVTRPSF